MRSAGSQSRVIARLASSFAIAGDIPQRRTSGSAAARSSHSSMSSPKRMRPRSTSDATSQNVISETQSWPASLALRTVRRWADERRLESSTHQRSACVSSSAGVTAAWPWSWSWSWSWSWAVVTPKHRWGPWVRSHRRDTQLFRVMCSADGQSRPSCLARHAPTVFLA